MVVVGRHSYLLLLIVGILLLPLNKMSGQELNCSVEVNSDQIQNVSKNVFQTLQDAIREYMNTTKFSDAQIGVNEKIECRLFFTIKEYSEDGKFVGDLQIQST